MVSCYGSVYVLTEQVFSVGDIFLFLNSGEVGEYLQAGGIYKQCNKWIQGINLPQEVLLFL